MKKAKKFFLMVGSLSAMLGVLTSCGGNEREKAFNANLTKILKEDIYDHSNTVDFKEFKLIGADIAKKSSGYAVKFNGVSSFSDSSRGYTCVNYMVPFSYFDDIEKGSKTDEMFEVFDSVISDLHYEDYVVSKVSDLSFVSDSFVKNTPSPFMNHSINQGVLYNLGNPMYVDETNTISFDVKTLVDIKQGDKKAGYGLGVGFDGNVGYDMVEVNVGVYTIMDRYNITLDDKTYDELKNNNSFIYDYCIDAIKNNSTELSVDRLLVSTVPYDNSILTSYFNSKQIEKGL